MRKTEYIEYAKLEMINDEFVRFKALSYCYDNVLVFFNTGIFDPKDIGKVFEITYQYLSGGPKINTWKEVSLIPVRQQCREKMISCRAS